MGRGVVPQELRERFGAAVNISLSDKRTETYSAPPAKRTFFGGEGQSLGGRPVTSPT